jgi:antitoxin CptB
VDARHKAGHDGVVTHDKPDRALYMKTRTRHPPGFWRWSGPLSGNSGGPAISSEGLDPRRRRLLFRSWHRGIREMDLVYGRFADAEIAKLSDIELDDLEKLLELRDQQVFDWIFGAHPLDEGYDTPLFRRLLAFHDDGKTIK